MVDREGVNVLYGVPYIQLEGQPVRIHRRDMINHTSEITVTLAHDREMSRVVLHLSPEDRKHLKNLLEDPDGD